VHLLYHQIQQNRYKQTSYIKWFKKQQMFKYNISESIARSTAARYDI
jgi:chloramphenicol O-acetyltransferase